MPIKHSMIFGITLLVKGALSFALIAIFTRLLSADAFGDYAVAIAIISFADVLSFMWLRQAVMRHITDHKDKNDQSYISNITILYAAIGAVIIAVGLLSGHKLIAALILTEGLSSLAILTLRLRLNLWTFFALNILKTSITITLGVVLIQSGMGVSGALWALLLACTATTLIGIAKSRDLKSIAFQSVSKVEIRAILAFGLPLIATLSTQSAIQFTDRILLETFIGDSITGLYAAAQDIPNKLLILIATAIHMAVYPLAVKALDHKGKAECDIQLRDNTMFLWGVLCPASCAIAILAAPLANVFLGEEFRPFATDYIPIFVAIALVNCVTQYYFILAFNFAKRTSRMIAPFIIALSLNAGIGVFLIPIMGAEGAILGSAAAYSILLILTILIGRKIFAMPVPIKDIVKITLAAAIMGITLLALNFGTNIIALLGFTLTGLLTYAAAILILNPINIRERIKP